MTKQKWQLKTHEEKPNWGTGDYDEYYEVVNERGDALQATDDYEGLVRITETMNAFQGEIRITTALEINLHCESEGRKLEIDHLETENRKMRDALYCIIGRIEGTEWEGLDIVQSVHKIKEYATEALKNNTHG